MEVRAHSAAGALLFAAIQGEIKVLLPFEGNRGTRRCKFYATPEGCFSGEHCDYIHFDIPNKQPEEYEMKRLNITGGRRESGESVLDTAIREISEETGGLITPAAIRTILRKDCAGPYPMSGGYEIYFATLGAEYHQLKDAYDWLENRPVTAEADYFVWASARDLLGPIQSNRAIGPYLPVDGVQYPMSHLLTTVLERYRTQIRAYLDAKFPPSSL